MEFWMLICLALWAICWALGDEAAAHDRGLDNAQKLDIAKEERRESLYRGYQA